jgi:hypothetical protein
LSAERRALAAAEAEEIRKNKEWRMREGISSGTAEDAAADLAGTQKDLQDDRIKGFKDAAGLLATERADKIAQDRTWAEADAIKKAASEQEKERIKASVSRAKEAEAKVTELYKGLPEANAEWDPETQSWKSGGDYMDMIYAAQDLAAAAWKDTGIKALMSERNINEPKFSYLSRSIVSVISLDLKKKKPEIWKGIVEGLNSAKGSADYEEAIETITPYLNDAIKESSIQTTSTEKAAIIEEIIEGIGAFAKYDQLEKDLGGGKIETSTTDTAVLAPSFFGSFFGGKPLDNIAADITAEDIGTVKKAQAALDALPARPSRVKSQEQKDLEKAKKRDPEYLLIHLNEEKIRIEGQLALPIYHPKSVQERLDKINELIKKFSSILAETGEDLGNGEAGPPLKNRLNTSSGTPKVSMARPPGMLNTGGGMIASAGLSPAALAQWEPEAVEARQQQRTA